MRRSLALSALAVVAVAQDAQAGRRFFGWLYGPEVMPERGAEIETWIFEENGKQLANEKATLFLWAATIGITDQLEVSFPAEWRWARSDTRDANFTFTRYGVDVRYRFVTQDPVDAPPLAPLLRLAIKRDVGNRDAIRTELDLVIAYTAGRVQAAIDLGAVGELAPETSRVELRPAAGVSVEAITDLRFGAEAYAQLDLDDSARSWAVLGPNVAWTHGRFWLSASYGIGLYQIDSAPRVVWGLAF